MRIAIVTESFLPSLNGVTTSVCRVLDSLVAQGHTPLVIAPGPAPTSYRGVPVRTVAGLTLRQFRVGLPSPELERSLRDFAPDVVHVASPFGLGARAVTTARRLGIPTVAIYQTDMPRYLSQYGHRLADPVERTAWRWVRHIHAGADLTLAPSTSAAGELRAHGIPRVALWSRGVDTGRFHPGLRSGAGAQHLRSMIAPHGETIIGYVGRLAPEKECHRLQEVADLPGTRLLIVGDGPQRRRLEQLLPQADFLGHRTGAELADAYAACDVFAHTGTSETFGQTLQEAMACGLPVVAPARGGPLDVVLPGRTGLLFNPDSPGALRAAVGGLVADPALRDRLGASGSRRMQQRSWATLTDELLGHYRSVLSPGRRSLVA
ncbi:glycosyltransferase family 4 protein [Dermacoccaceae bacterium W4C1]